MLIRGFSNVLSFCLLVSTGSLVACGGSRSDKTDGAAETQSLEGPRNGNGIKKSAKSERFTSDGKNGEGIGLTQRPVRLMPRPFITMDVLSMTR